MLGAAGGGGDMDKKSLEFSCLLGWLRTFPLQSQVGQILKYFLLGEIF